MTLHPAGTRIRLFPELFAGYRTPETVLLSPQAGSLGPGPADAQMYVANARDKRSQYAPPGSMPPWRGAEYAPALPDAAGHFDAIPVGTPQFLAAHLYGSARHTLDIWEHYLGQRVRWWHAPAIPQLELVPVVAWANAHSGPGFLETGVIRNEHGDDHLFCMNFDVVAHEIGHAVLFATIGVPAPGALSADYLAFHESFSDLFGVIGVLRFASVIARLLAQTGGNLHALNLVNRLGAYSDNQQVRLAANAKTMADVAGIALLPDGSWHDPSGQNRNQHALGEPLTGAIFDMLVDVFQTALVTRGAIAPGLDGRGRSHATVLRALPAMHRRHARTLQRRPELYHDALLEGRDVVGFAMAQAIKRLHPETLTFPRVAAHMLEAACALGQGPHIRRLLGLFLGRGIDPLPFLTVEHARLRVRDDAGSGRERCADPAAFLHAQRMVRHGHGEHAIDSASESMLSSMS